MGEGPAPARVKYALAGFGAAFECLLDPGRFASFSRTPKIQVSAASACRSAPEAAQSWAPQKTGSMCWHAEVNVQCSRHFAHRLAVCNAAVCSSHLLRLCSRLNGVPVKALNVLLHAYIYSVAVRWHGRTELRA